MSFVEFLLEYYIYILSVLIILIVGVIGFLVDSKNKEKVQQNDNVNSDKENHGESTVNSDTMMQMNNMNANMMANDNESLIQQQDNNQMSIEQSPVMDIQLNQEPLNNLGAVNSLDADTNINGDINNMQYNVPSEMTNTDSSINDLNANIYNGGNSVNGMKPQTIGAVLEQTAANNLVSDMQYKTDVDSSVNNLTNVQSGMVDMSLNNVKTQVNPINYSNMNSGINNLANAQPQMVNMNNDQNINNNMNYVNNVQPEILNQQVTPVNMASFNDSNNMMYSQNVAHQGTNVNNSVMNNNFNQSGMRPVEMAQNNNVINQPQDVNSLPNNNVVLTTDNAQPFDISSMFANNNQ